MRLLVSVMLALICFATGCNVQTGVSPTETIIDKSAGRNFDFEGTWLPMPSEGFPRDDSSYEMTITRDEDYTAVMRDLSLIHI